MNNLKKVLALGLALVMLLGMFTIASAAEDKKMIASDLADWDSVAHKDAVALNVDLGIINGIEEGGVTNFKPEDNIDRSSWAKMVYFAATGDDDASSFVGDDPVMPDIDNDWAEGYITYLYVNKYISGDGNGNYNPKSNVRVDEACKMMLTVLGYDANNRGYQNNAAWSGNIMNDAKRNGLMRNVAQGASEYLTRDNAAEIIYNALQANTVEQETQMDGGIAYVTKHTKVSTLGYDVFNVIRIEAKVARIDKDGYAVFEKPVYPGDLAIGITANQISNKVKASGEVVGETVSIFVKALNVEYNGTNAEMKSEDAAKIKLDKIISTTVARSAAGADVVYNGGFNINKINDSANEYYVATNFKIGVNVYVNGELKELNVNAGDSTQDTYRKNYTDAVRNKLAGLLSEGDGVTSRVWDGSDPIPGLIVEFYLDDESNIETVKIYDYKVAELTGDLETRTSGGVLQVKVPGIDGLTTWTDADKVTGYQGLVEGDVVLYYATQPKEGTARDSAYTIEKAAVVTGKISTISSSGQIKVDGKNYKKSSLYTDVTSASTLNNNGFAGIREKNPEWLDIDLNLYLDKAGAVCAIIAAEEAVNKGNVVMILDAEWTASGLSTTSGMKAQLLFMNGDDELVTISKLNGDTIVSTATEGKKEITGGPKSGGTTDGATAAEGTAIYEFYHHKLDSDMDPHFYTYRVSGGSYELTEVVSGAGKTDWATPAYASSTTVLKQPDFTSGNLGLSADDATVFVVAKGNNETDMKYYSYTGFDNVPEMAEAYAAAIGTNDNAGTAKFVFLKTTTYSDDVPEGYYFIYNNKWEEDPELEDVYLINVVDPSGNVGQLRVDWTLANDVASDKTSELANWNTTNQYVGSFVKVTAWDENNMATALEPVAGVKGGMDKLTKLGGKVVLGEGNLSHNAYDNVTKFVYVDLSVVDAGLEGDAEGDTLEFYTAGTFNPNNFFNPDSVYADPQVGQIAVSDAVKAYDSINVITVGQSANTQADYIYILRVMW